MVDNFYAPSGPTPVGPDVHQFVADALKNHNWRTIGYETDGNTVTYHLESGGPHQQLSADELAELKNDLIAMRLVSAEMTQGHEMVASRHGDADMVRRFEPSGDISFSIVLENCEDI